MISIHRFIRELRDHTKQAKARWEKVNAWGVGSGWSAAEIGVTVLTEEVGKLARTINKLHLADDDLVRAQWKREQRRYKPLNLWLVFLVAASTLLLVAVVMRYAAQIDALF